MFLFFSLFITEFSFKLAFRPLFPSLLILLLMVVWKFRDFSFLSPEIDSIPLASRRVDGRSMSICSFLYIACPICWPAHIIIVLCSGLILVYQDPPPSSWLLRSQRVLFGTGLAQYPHHPVPQIGHSCCVSWILWLQIVGPVRFPPFGPHFDWWLRPIPALFFSKVI